MDFFQFLCAHVYGEKEEANQNSRINIDQDIKISAKLMILLKNYTSQCFLKTRYSFFNEMTNGFQIAAKLSQKSMVFDIVHGCEKVLKPYLLSEDKN